MDIIGGLLLVARAQRGVTLIDVAIPFRPTLVGEYGRCAADQVVGLEGGYAAVGCFLENSIALVDIRQPQQPRFVRNYTVPGTRRMIGLHGMLYLLGTHFDVVDVRDPSLPVRLSRDAPPADPAVSDAKVVGDVLYVVGSSLQLFDVRDARRPVALATSAVPAARAPDDSGAGAVLALDGERLLLGDTHGTGFTVMLRQGGPAPAPSPTASRPPSASPTPSAPPSATGRPTSTASPAATEPLRSRIVWLPWVEVTGP